MGIYSWATNIHQPVTQTTAEQIRCRKMEEEERAEMTWPSLLDSLYICQEDVHCQMFKRQSCAAAPLLSLRVYIFGVYVWRHVVEAGPHQGYTVELSPVGAKSLRNPPPGCRLVCVHTNTRARSFSLSHSPPGTSLMNLVLVCSGHMQRSWPKCVLGSETSPHITW